MTLAELLHHQVTLRLTQFTVQRICIVSVLYQLVGNFLRFQTGAAEDNAVNHRVEVNDTFQRQVFVFSMYDVCYVVYVLRSFILRTDGNFLRIVKISLSNTGDFRAHRSREHQSIAVGWHFLQNSIDAIGKAHVQHFVCFIHHYVTDGFQLRYFSLDKVDKASRSSDNDMYALLQAFDLALDGRTSINGYYLQVGDILRIIIQVTCYLQAKFARRAKNQCLRHAVTYVNFLYQRQAKCSCFSGSGLCQSHYIVPVSQQVRNHFFLYRHGILISHFFNRFAYFRGYAKFFKCLHLSIMSNSAAKIQTINDINNIIKRRDAKAQSFLLNTETQRQFFSSAAKNKSLCLCVFVFKFFAFLRLCVWFYFTLPPGIPICLRAGNPVLCRWLPRWRSAPLWLFLSSGWKGLPE